MSRILDFRARGVDLRLRPDGSGFQFRGGDDEDMALLQEQHDFILSELQREAGSGSGHVICHREHVLYWIDDPDCAGNELWTVDVGEARRFQSEGDARRVLAAAGYFPSEFDFPPVVTA